MTPVRLLTTLGLTIASSVMIAQTPAGSKPSPVSATVLPRLEIPVVEKSPSMDGASLEGWDSAKVIEDFVPWFPNNSGNPPAKTTAYLLWGKDALYVAVRAYDPDPSKIRAYRVRRDGIYVSTTTPPQFQQDAIRIDLDPSGKGASAVTVICNPYGIQEDGLTSNQTNYDQSVDLDWSSTGVMLADGYMVKFRIPLNSLQGARNDWKIRLSRSYPRGYSYVMSWPMQPPESQYYLANMASINCPPNAKFSAPFYVIPYVSYSSTKTTDPETGLTTKDHKSSAGADLRYATQGRSFEATYNPDFSAIEADIDPLLVNSRFKAYLSEKRPFFMNGMDVPTVSSGTVQQFYSRSILQPDYAVKANGNEKWGSWFALYGKDNYGGNTFSMNVPVDSPTRDYVLGTQIPLDKDGSYVNIVGTRRDLMDMPAANNTGGLYLQENIGNFSCTVSRIDTLSTQKNQDGLRGFNDNVGLAYSDANNSFAVARTRNSPDIDLSMGYLDLNGYVNDQASYKRAFNNSDKKGYWVKAYFMIYDQEYYWWNGNKFWSTSNAQYSVNWKGGIKTTLDIGLRGKEWLDANTVTKRIADTLTVSCTGIKGLRTTVSYMKGEAPDYYTGLQAQEKQDTAQATVNYWISKFTIDYIHDRLFDDPSHDLSMDAKRTYIKLDLIFPQDFYARCIYQDVKVFRPVDDSRKHTIYTQLLFGWQPSAFTNFYIGRTLNKTTDNTLPFQERGDRFFAKFSMSFRF